MKFGWIYKKGKKVATDFARVEKCKGTEAVASVDVFEARTLGRYLKPRGEVWTSRDVQKATTINRRRSATSLIPKRMRCWWLRIED